MGRNDKKVISLSGVRDKDKSEKVENKQSVICSFCGRPNQQVIKMIKGPGVNICSECIMICIQYFMLEDRIPSSEAQKVLDAFWRGSKE
ncbi:MAG: ClpX C4-type zinc finger protein [Candidatus Gastranaerophilales bacterium]|nr:ClpX C4-type zinc finger protein [Candidatus Gastranaerophilales bacterium]